MIQRPGPAETTSEQPEGRIGRLGGMLSLACVGMAGYGLYSIGAGAFDLAIGHHLEVWANLGLVALGLFLLLAAAFVRVMIPGGLALALGAMLGLQGLSLHNDLHWYGAILLAPQLGRGLFAAVLIVLALIGARANVADIEVASEEPGSK
jgi:hypothetical protein